MRTPYQDVEILDRTGYWPDGKVPDWAEKLFAKRDGCRSASAAADWAKSQEIARLRAVNAKLLNLLDAAAGEICRMHNHISPHCNGCSSLDIVTKIREMEAESA